MQKRHNSGVTILCITLLMGLLVGAFYMPGLLNMIYDKQTQNQINTRNLWFEVYQSSYDDFEEKAHAIGMAVADGAELAFIEIAGAENVWLNASFTEEQLKAEMEELLVKKLGIKLEVEQMELGSCKLYNIFGTGQSSGNVLSGIQVYEMIYMPKEYVHIDMNGKLMGDYQALRLYVDAEFHKIYAFQLYALRDVIYLDLVNITEQGTEILATYWGIGQKYKKSRTTIASDEYGENSGFWGGVYKEKLTFGSNAQIYVGLEGYVDNTEKVVRMGMQPFFDAFYSEASVYSVSD